MITNEKQKKKSWKHIATLDDAQKFIELGASRLGTSRIVKIVKDDVLYTENKSDN